MGARCCRSGAISCTPCMIWLHNIFTISQPSYRLSPWILLIVNFVYYRLGGGSHSTVWLSFDENLVKLTLAESVDDDNIDPSYVLTIPPPHIPTTRELVIYS